ncbi:unnamed protein product [Rotaria sp. Silwood1]|nr:unnamed protein product [Rotaria sp. Silwood1]CAF1540401.1 unnamed protein product [Rotaria sp. Silwood1]
MNRIIEIPSDLIKNGKTLTIEKYSQLFINGYHLSQPSNFVRHNHGLCLIDTQQQDIKSGTYTHQFESNNDEFYLVQLIIEFPGEILNTGKSITIEKNDSNEDELSGNLEDLYNVENLKKSERKKDIIIKIPKKYIQRGKTIIIQKDNIFVTNSDEYHKKKSHRLTNYKFAKQNYLQLKNMMEMTIEVSPELFDDNQKITFRKENSDVISGNFPYRRQSKHDVQVNIKDALKNKNKNAIEEFLSNKIWNPVLSDDGNFIKLSLNFNNQPNIINQDQLKIILDQQNLRVETKDQQGFHIYQQIILPEKTKSDQTKYQFDEKHHSLNITLPIHQTV